VVDIAWHMPVDVGTRRSDWSIADPGMGLTRAPQVTTHSPARDYSEQTLLLGRLKSGTCRESQRVVHVFELAPDLRESPVVAARCGAKLLAGDLQWLPRFSGMPCERCVMTTRD
jgi:hypothetical protein